MDALSTAGRTVRTGRRDASFSAHRPCRADHCFTTKSRRYSCLLWSQCFRRDGAYRPVL